ncbi:amino acid transporter [Reticulibacter mediterranei]|uniref:Amino acid transporter n=1 Tax=Reticulibacter mediterranei TaxID=2778369 RepID=A0A8J3J2Y0_9CHLR|nr:APC family permease [Reticulibacter mediterranei]GHP00577.1 amino acid transporter [Reticulibacter mediterranei]
MTVTFIPRPEPQRPVFHRQPLTSETYLPEVLPPVLGSGDLIAQMIVNVFWISNITPILAGGPVVFLYLVICGVCFFIPCSVVMAQLAAIFPHEGGIYNWTFHCLGKNWAFFVSLCTWLPGVLSILNALIVLNSCAQTANPHWLTEPWQQGAAILFALTFVGIISTRPTRTVQTIMNGATIGMGVATVLILAATLIWLLSGRPSATTEWVLPHSVAQINSGLFGNTTLALLGSNIPLALIGETRNRQQATRSHLYWGTGLTLAGYFVWFFALLTIQGAQAAANQANPIVLLVATVTSVFGPFIGKLFLIDIGFYYLIIAITLNLCYSRLLIAFAADGRLSGRFCKVNVYRVPTYALLFQVAMVVVFASVLYFIVPLFTGLGRSASDLNSIAYNVVGASLTLVWALSYMAPFVNVTLLYLQARHAVMTQWFLSLPALLFCAILGVLTLGISIVTTLLNSFIPTLIPNTNWMYIIGLAILVCLGFCLLLTMYGNSEARYEQMQG